MVCCENVANKRTENILEWRSDAAWKHLASFEQKRVGCGVSLPPRLYFFRPMHRSLLSSQLFFSSFRFISVRSDTRHHVEAGFLETSDILDKTTVCFIDCPHPRTSLENKKNLGQSQRNATILQQRNFHIRK